MTRMSGRQIRRAHLLARLDQTERRIVQLTYLDGLTVPAAGALLGLDRREAEQLVRTARQHLRAFARPEGGKTS